MDVVAANYRCISGTILKHLLVNLTVLSSTSLLARRYYINVAVAVGLDYGVISFKYFAFFRIM